MHYGVVTRVKQQVGENVDAKRLVCDIRLDTGGPLNNVPYYGGGVDSVTKFPHGLFIPPRENQKVAVAFIQGYWQSPVCCFPIPHPCWKIEEKNYSDYNDIMGDLDDIGLFHYSGSRIYLKSSGKIEIAKKIAAVEHKIEFEITATKVKVKFPTATSVELGSNALQALCNNFPNCIFSGALHAVGNVQVKV